MPALPDLATCKKLGFIVPSSNHAVEPITTAIIQSTHSNIICLFTRIRVLTLSPDAKTASQFSSANLIPAAQLLADAQCDAILWNGTSGMFIGTTYEDDLKLAKQMTEACGVPCATTAIATVEALQALGIKRLSIAVPYTEALIAKVRDFFDGCGFIVVKTARLEETPSSNLEVAKSSSAAITEVITRSDSGESEAIVVACTNWPGAGLVEQMEVELDKPVIDSIVVTAWKALKMIGFSNKLEGWGRLLTNFE